MKFILTMCYLDQNGHKDNCNHEEKELFEVPGEP